MSPKKDSSHSLLPGWGEGEDEGHPARDYSPHPNPLPVWGEGNSTTLQKTLTTITNNLHDFSDAPELDAQRIILHALEQREPSYLLAHSDIQLTPEQLAETTRMQNLRKTGMPLAYILGESDFYGRTFIVTPDVLIPRSDTELLVKKALEYIRARHPGPRAGIHVDLSGFRVPTSLTSFAGRSKPGMTLTIADIGTGSGCIIITLALELYNLPATTYRLIATDISPAALAIAKQNAAKHGVLDKIAFLQGDMLKPITNRHVDLIVSNPPYLPAEALAKAGCAPETLGLKFEPQSALDGGVDGLDFVRQIQASGIPAIIETIGGEIIECY